VAKKRQKVATKMESIDEFWVKKFSENSAKCRNIRQRVGLATTVISLLALTLWHSSSDAIHAG
jgi:hypothetical protein